MPHDLHWAEGAWEQPTTSLKMDQDHWKGLDTEDSPLGGSHPPLLFTFLAHFPFPAYLGEISRGQMGLFGGRSQWAGLMATPGGHQGKTNIWPGSSGL